jgi:uncharacterized membrane protein YeiH
MMDRLQEELGVIAASFALVGAVGGGRTSKVTIGVAPFVEEKTTLTLLLVFLFFMLVLQLQKEHTKGEVAATITVTTPIATITPTITK